MRFRQPHDFGLGSTCPRSLSPSSFSVRTSRYCYRRKGMISRIAAGEYSLTPGMDSSGGATTYREMYCARGERSLQICHGIVCRSNQPKEGRAPGGKYSMFGRARILSERLGVPPCQSRLSRKIAAPAGGPGDSWLLNPACREPQATIVTRVSICCQLLAPVLLLSGRGCSASSSQGSCIVRFAGSRPDMASVQCAGPRKPASRNVGGRCRQR